MSQPWLIIKLNRLKITQIAFEHAFVMQFELYPILI